MKVYRCGLGFVQRVMEYCFLLKRDDEKKKCLVGEDLLRVLESRSKTFSRAEKCGVVALYIIHSVLLAAKDSKQVNEYHLAWVENPTFFASYPWGRACFELTLKSLRKNFHKKAKKWKKKGNNKYCREDETVLQGRRNHNHTL